MFSHLYGELTNVGGLRAIGARFVPCRVVVGPLDGPARLVGTRAVTVDGQTKHCAVLHAGVARHGDFADGVSR